MATRGCLQFDTVLSIGCLQGSGGKYYCHLFSVWFSRATD